MPHQKRPRRSKQARRQFKWASCERAHTSVRGRWLCCDALGSGPPEHPQGAGGLGTFPQRDGAVVFCGQEIESVIATAIRCKAHVSSVR